MSVLVTTQYLTKAPFSLDALSLTLAPLGDAHPNKAPFHGVLTRIDEASTRPPHGSNGHKVLIPRAVAQAALPSLAGMPIDFSAGLTDHDKQRVVGIIEQGSIAGNDLLVAGYLLEKNWPDDVAAIRRQKHVLGMSYEVSDVEVADVNASVWTLTHLTFTGAAILLKDAAAYQDTAIAAATEDLSMADSDALFEQLTKLNTTVSLLAAHDEEADADAAMADEEEAASLAEQAAAARTQAQRARTDADADDAARHDEDAAAKHLAASGKRTAAAQRYDALATRAKEAKDETTATKFEASATRLREEDATQQALVAAALKTQEQEASATKEAPEDRMMALFAKFMGLMAQTDGKGKTALDAEHDDEEDDKALIRQMLKKKQDDQKASTVTLDLQTKRDLRQLRASTELITDTLKKVTGLITDMQAQLRGLATDTSRGINGGPVRRSMQGTGERYVGKFDDDKTATKPTETEFDAQLQAKGITDVRERMKLSFEARTAGQLQ